MSADNVILVREYKGKWHVWQTSMSMFSSDYPEDVKVASTPVRQGYCHGIFKNRESALIYANALCEDDYIEYGVAEIGTESEKAAQAEKKSDEKAISDVIETLKRR